jgi:hypothetical protein
MSEPTGGGDCDEGLREDMAPVVKSGGSEKGMEEGSQ